MAVISSTSLRACARAISLPQIVLPIHAAPSETYTTCCLGFITARGNWTGSLDSWQKVGCQANLLLARRPCARNRALGCPVGMRRAAVPYTACVSRAGHLKKTRILLADDHPYFPQLVERLLGHTFEVVGSVCDGRALVEAAGRLKPDVIITDISMPVLNGLEAAEELKKSGSRSKIIFLTIHSGLEFVRACLSLGAVGYVVKPRVATELELSIREAMAGRVFVSPQASMEHRGKRASCAKN